MYLLRDLCALCNNEPLSPPPSFFPRLRVMKDLFSLSASVTSQVLPHPLLPLISAHFLFNTEEPKAQFFRVQELLASYTPSLFFLLYQNGFFSFYSSHEIENKNNDTKNDVIATKNPSSFCKLPIRWRYYDGVITMMALY